MRTRVKWDVDLCKKIIKVVTLSPHNLTVGFENAAKMYPFLTVEKIRRNWYHKGCLLYKVRTENKTLVLLTFNRKFYNYKNNIRDKNGNFINKNKLEIIKTNTVLIGLHRWFQSLKAFFN